ncbi:MAG: contractile injection system tape measure protein [Trichormus sp.]
MNTQSHIIGRTVLELDIGQLADVWSLQEDMSSLLQQQGVREMARLFDELVGDGSVVRLDQVVVDIGSIDSRFLADEFIQSLLAALRETLGDRLTDRLLGEAPAETVTKSRHAADWEVLLYFLSYGRLPWWCPYEHWQEWLSRWSVAMQNNTNWQAPLRELLKNNSAARQRLVEQLPENFRHELILQFEPSWLNWHTLLGQARQLMQALGLAGDGVRYLERLAWLLLFAEIGADNAPNTPLPAASWISNWLAQLVDIWERTAAPLIVQNQPVNAEEIPSTQDNSQYPLPITQSLVDAIVAVVAREEQGLWLEELDQVLTNAVYKNISNLTPNPFPTREGEQESKPLSLQGRGLERGFENKSHIALNTTSVNLDATDTPGAEQNQSPQQEVEIVNPQPNSSDVENLTPSPRSDWEILLYFLESGRWFGEQPRDDWQDWLPRWLVAMQNNTNWQAPLRELLKNNSAARQRLVEQLPENFRHELILQFEPSWLNWHTLLGQARQLMQALGLAGDGVRYLERLAWLLLFAEIGADNAPNTPLPAASWISNWLAQLVDIWERTAAPLIVQNQPVNAEEIPSTQDNSQSLHSAIIAAVTSGEQDIWLMALDQVLTNISENLAETDTTNAGLEQFNPQSVEIVNPQPNRSDVENLTQSPRSDWEILLYFLESGRWFGEQPRDDWQDWLPRWLVAMQNNTNWQAPLRELLKNNSAARQRLVEQLPENFRHELILQFEPSWLNWHTLLGQARQLMQALGLAGDGVRYLERQAWLLLFEEIGADNAPLTPLPAARWISNWLAQLVDIWERTAASLIVQNQPVNAEEIPSTQDNSQYPLPITQSLVDAIVAVVAREEQGLWLEELDQVLTNAVYKNISNLTPNPFPTREGEQESKPLSLEGRGLERGFENKSHIELTTTSINLSATDTAGAGQDQSRQQGAEFVSQQRLPEAATESFGADWEVLLYFLQSGRLPVREISEDWLTLWSTVIQNETAWQLPLRQLLATNPTARRRLVAQFPSSWRHQLLLQLQPAWTSWYNLLAQARLLMQSLSLSNDCFSELENLAWELMLTEINADGSSLTPLPGATWTRNWLTQLVENWRWGAGGLGAGEQGSRGVGGESDELAGDVNLNQIAWERLRTSIDGVSRSQRGLWLNAYNQVLNVTTKGQQVGMPQLPQTPPETDWQVLLYFLESGRLPEEEASTTWQAWLQRWETKSETETAQQIPLRQLLKNNVAARQRFITQFPEALRHQLVLQLQPAWTNWYTLLGQAKQIMLSSSLSNSSCQELETLAWELLLREISADNSALNPLPVNRWMRHWLTLLVESWRRGVGEQGGWGVGEQGCRGDGEEEIGKRNLRLDLRQLITTLPITETTLWLNALELVVTATSPDEGNTPPSIPPDTKTTTPTEEPTPLQQPSAKQVERGTPEITNPLSIPPRRARGSTLSTEEERAGVYVNIAGIVLLHPFLTFYLDAVGLLEGESFRDELAQQTAIYLLYYLATKQTDAPEYELVLPKLLCGWPLNEPVSRGLDLPTIALTEGENLLQTVINYWEVLKSTSRDGLREGFLQRAGKLTHGDGNWKLQVEQQAIDILLSRLPWGLSMVKLPWMEEILIVEWH